MEVCCGGIPTNKQDSTHTQGSRLNSWIIIFFQLTMHMFSDPHTFVILTPFLLPLFDHIQNSTNHFATFSFLFHALQEEGVVGSFLYIYWLLQHT